MSKKSSSGAPWHDAMKAPSGLGYAWAAPVTLVGLVLAALLRALGGVCTWRQGVLEASGGLLGAWVGRASRIEALTLGHVVLAVHGQAQDHWRRHERVHVAQFERWGALLPCLYAAEMGRWRWRGLDAYQHNGFEREARLGVHRWQRAQRTACRRADEST